MLECPQCGKHFDPALVSGDFCPTCADAIRDEFGFAAVLQRAWTRWKEWTRRLSLIVPRKVERQPADSSRMPEKLTNEQRHERFWCGFTHIRAAWIFVAFCGLEVFMNWRDLDKPISRPDIIELPFYVLIVVVYAPIFWMVLRCFTERLVIGIATAHMAITVFSRFAPRLFVPSLFNPVTVSIHRAFLILWIIAFLVSLNMPVQAVRHPYVQLDKIPTSVENRGLLILCAVIVTAIVLGALTYFVPLR
jgi:hypothetical protein